MLLYYVLKVFPSIAIISAIIYIPFYVYIKRCYGKQIVLYHLAKYALIGCLLSLIYLTLLWYYPNITFHPDYYFLNLRPFVWVYEVYDMGPKKMMMQLMMNIGMFVPLGLLLPIAIKNMRKLWKTLAVTLSFTLVIEITQYFMGRSADIDDVIMNLIGGLIGYALFALLNRCRIGNLFQFHSTV